METDAISVFTARDALSHHQGSLPSPPGFHGMKIGSSDQREGLLFRSCWNENESAVAGSGNKRTDLMDQL